MGCDIHLHTEVKIDGQWHHYNTPEVPRSYALFSLMAGVRGEHDPVTRRKGFPDDASAVTKLDQKHWDCDAHSYSWLSSEEILQLSERMKELWPKYNPLTESDYFGFFFENDYSGFHKYPEDRYEGVEDVRFVFWFDN